MNGRRRAKRDYQDDALADPPALAADAPLPPDEAVDVLDELLVLVLLVLLPEDELELPELLELPADADPPPPLVEVEEELPATLKLAVWPPRVRTTTVRIPLPLKLRVCVVAKLPLAEPKPACTGWLAVTVTVVQPLLLLVATQAASVVSVVATATVVEVDWLVEAVAVVLAGFIDELELVALVPPELAAAELEPAGSTSFAVTGAGS